MFRTAISVPSAAWKERVLNRQEEASEIKSFSYRMIVLVEMIKGADVESGYLLL